jgi:hypothetical protein
MLALISKLRTRNPDCLQDAAEIKRGVLFDKSLLTDSKISENSHPYFEGDIYRYSTHLVAPQWVEYGPKMKEYPKEFKWFSGPRILLRRLVNRQQRLMASLISEPAVTNKNLYSMLPLGSESIQYLLGILNSRLFSRLYLAQVSQATKDDFPQVTIRDVGKLPLRRIASANARDKTLHDQMVQLVQTMLDLNKKLQTAKTAHDKTLLERRIAATDNQIDQLVYKLYDLTEEEIAIIEGTS